MSYKILDHQQGTTEWVNSRLGIWTASNFSKAVTSTLKPSKQAVEHNQRLVAEKITGEPVDGFYGGAMQRGHDLEPDAFEFLKFTTGYDFRPCGFVDSGKGYGCSPDGIDPERKVGLELKCPEPHTLIKWLAAKKIPTNHLIQVIGSLWVMDDFKEWIFCAYHPLIKPLVITVKRSEIEEEIQKIREAILYNVTEVELMYHELKNDL